MTQQIAMDMRYCSLVAWMLVEQEQATPGDVLGVMAVRGRDAQTPSQTLAGTYEAVAAATATRTLQKQFTPVPCILAGGLQAAPDDDKPRIEAHLPNVLSDEYFFSALIYLFNVQARQTTALAPLLWSRGPN